MTQKEIKLAYILVNDGSIESVWDNEADAIDVWVNAYRPGSNIVIRVMNNPFMPEEEKGYRNSLHAKMRAIKPEPFKNSHTH